MGAFTTIAPDGQGEGDRRVGKVGAALVPSSVGIRAAFLSLKSLAGAARWPLQNPRPALL